MGVVYILSSTFTLGEDEKEFSFPHLHEPSPVRSKQLKIGR